MAGGGFARLSELPGANRGYTATTPTPQEPPGPSQTVVVVELALAGPELQGRPCLTEAQRGKRFSPQSGDDHAVFGPKPKSGPRLVTR